MTDPEKFPLVACPTCGAISSSLNEPDPCPVCARVAAERERCAKIAEETAAGIHEDEGIGLEVGREIAAAIRARGAKAQ